MYLNIPFSINSKQQFIDKFFNFSNNNINKFDKNNFKIMTFNVYMWNDCYKKFNFNPSDI